MYVFLGLQYANDSFSEIDELNSSTETISRSRRTQTNPVAKLRQNILFVDDHYRRRETSAKLATHRRRVGLTTSFPMPFLNIGGAPHPKSDVELVGSATYAEGQRRIQVDTDSDTVLAVGAAFNIPGDKKTYVITEGRTGPGSITLHDGLSADIASPGGVVLAARPAMLDALHENDPIGEVQDGILRTYWSFIENV